MSDMAEKWALNLLNAMRDAGSIGRVVDKAFIVQTLEEMIKEIRASGPSSGQVCGFCGVGEFKAHLPQCPSLAMQTGIAPPASDNCDAAGCHGSYVILNAVPRVRGCDECGYPYDKKTYMYGAKFDVKPKEWQGLGIRAPQNIGILNDHGPGMSRMAHVSADSESLAYRCPRHGLTPPFSDRAYDASDLPRCYSCGDELVPA